MTTNEIITAIVSTNISSTDLSRINRTVLEKIKFNRERTIYQNKAQLMIGDPIIIKGLRESTGLNGRRGTITDIKTKKCHVKLEIPSVKYGSRINLNMSCVEKAGLKLV